MKTFLIVAHEDSTEISVNGRSQVYKKCKGEYYMVEGDQFINNNMYVNTYKRTFVAYQGIGGTGSEANQGYVLCAASKLW